MNAGTRSRTRVGHTSSGPGEQHAGPSLRLVAMALLILQATWILAVPPFRASDEFDHAYRAASVARGDWVAAATDATRGTGAVVAVPSDLVAAARPECERLGYTTPADCVGTTSGGTSEVATGAGRYNPVYYFVIGSASLPFDGAAAVYAMRVASALLFLAFLLAALASSRMWARSRWPVTGIVAACSPVVLFSSAVAAPNGLEMAAAAALWSALMGLARVRDSRSRLVLLTVGAASAAALVTLRSLGPLWALLIVAAVLVSIPDRRETLVRLVRDRSSWIAALLVLIAALLSAGWILLNQSLVIGKLPDPPTSSAVERAGNLMKATVAWILQSIAAFPFRNNAAPVAVYACYLALVAWLAATGLRAATSRERAAIALVMLGSLLVPLAITVATYESYGVAWQGRYTIPLSMGFLILSGAALDRRGWPLNQVVRVATGGLFVLAHVLSPLSTVLEEREKSPGVANGDWVLVSPVLLGVAAVLGAVLLWAQSTSVAPGSPVREDA